MTATSVAFFNNHTLNAVTSLHLFHSQILSHVFQGQYIYKILKPIREKPLQAPRTQYQLHVRSEWSQQSELRSDALWKAFIFLVKLFTDSIEPWTNTKQKQSSNNNENKNKSNWYITKNFNKYQYASVDRDSRSIIKYPSKKANKNTSISKHLKRPNMCVWYE